MDKLLKLARPLVVRALTDHLDSLADDLDGVSPWTPDLKTRLLDYATRGKLIRGSLVYQGYALFRPLDLEKADVHIKNLTALAAIMELLQSMLLIHDDIMDQDDYRRGKPSIHFQYRSLAEERLLARAHRFGESMGICMGDVAGFSCLGLLADLEVQDLTRRRILALLGRELSLVGLAQMQDVHHGHLPGEAPMEDIINLYRYKTGRYTFSLPLMLGALVAEAPDQDIKILSTLGEEFGIIFQIVDDEIGLFADQEISGKPQGADVGENKKTLHRHLLLQHASEQDRTRALGLYGMQGLATEDLTWLLGLHEDLGIRSMIREILARHEGLARGLMAGLESITTKGLDGLQSLLGFNLTRRW